MPCHARLTFEAQARWPQAQAPGDPDQAQEGQATPRWVPFVFFTCVGVGVVLILATYIFWNGQPSTLFGGLGLIGVAFAVSTQWY